MVILEAGYHPECALRHGGRNRECVLGKLVTGQLSGTFTDFPLHSTPNSPLQPKSSHAVLVNIDCPSMFEDMGNCKPLSIAEL